MADFILLGSVGYLATYLYRAYNALHFLIVRFTLMALHPPPLILLVP